MKPSTFARAALVAAAAVSSLAFAAAPAQAAPGARLGHHDCFQSTDWQGWSSPSPNILYLRVRIKDVYRLDLSAGSNQLQWPSNHLINTIRGSSLVCSAIDLDLAVSDGNGFVQPLIVKSIRKLTPEEVAALPKKDRP
ncbi:MAG: hypothetical protein JWP35_2906 [Caulobacter sp.]|nr:hypothetical protein [Caulobacter sp.]